MSVSNTNGLNGTNFALCELIYMTELCRGHCDAPRADPQHTRAGQPVGIVPARRPPELIPVSLTRVHHQHQQREKRRTAPAAS